MQKSLKTFFPKPRFAEFHECCVFAIKLGASEGKMARVAMKALVSLYFIARIKKIKFIATFEKCYYCILI